MPHVRELRINKFRGLRDLHIENPGQINLFVGNNNSGKTSVLEALLLFCDPLSMRRWNEAASQREAVITLRSSSVDRLIWLFSQAQEESQEENNGFSIEASGSIPIKKVVTTYEKFNEVTTQLNLPKALIKSEDIADERFEEREVDIEGIRVHVSVFLEQPQPSLFEENLPIQETLSFSDYISTREKRQSRLVMPVQLINPFTHRTNTLTSVLWSEAVEADLKDKTIKLLQHFDPDILDVDFISPTERRQLISIKHKKLGRAPLSTFGDGLRRVFTLATTIPRIRNGFLLVDELETAIHTQALERTFKWLIKACVDNNVQLFATTHSLEALDAMLETSREQVDFVTYRLQQNKDKTLAQRFDKETTLRLREDLGMELRY